VSELYSTSNQLHCFVYNHGRLKERYLIRPPMKICSSGIYRLRRGKDEFEVFIPSNVFAAAQGLAFSADEKTIYVADFTDGLWALDVGSKSRRRVDGPADAWLAGLDGLSRSHCGADRGSS
jgi:hypothetical protein